MNNGLSKAKQPRTSDSAVQTLPDNLVLFDWLIVDHRSSCIMI